MIIKPLQLDDFRHVISQLRENSRAEALACCEDVRLLMGIFQREDNGLSWSFSLDEPVYVGGAILKAPGVYTLWGLATDRFPEMALPLTRWIRRVMMPDLKRRGATQIEATGIAGYGLVTAWMRVIGAKPAEMLPHYGRNGETFILYRWVI